MRLVWIAHPADRLNVLRALVAPIILLSPFWYGFAGGSLWLAALVTFAAVGKLDSSENPDSRAYSEGMA